MHKQCIIRLFKFVKTPFSQNIETSFIFLWTVLNPFVSPFYIQTVSDLFKIENALLLQGVSDSYRKNNNIHWRRYINFCILYGVKGIPANQETLCLYAAFRFKTSTIIGASFKNELYGIRSVHIDLGYELDIRKGSMKRLGRIRDGWTRLRTSNQRLKKPVTSVILKKFLACLSPLDRDHQTLRAILCFAKFGLLRVSEYTYGINGNSPKVKDISLIPDAINPDYLVYRFNKSKCNQFKKRERIVCVCTCPNPCAIHELVNMLAFRKITSINDNLFQLKNGSCPTDNQVRNLISSLCGLCGLNPKEFSSHQLRSGGVVDLLCAGVADSVVQELARWANLDSMIPYKKLSDENLAKLIRKQ